MKEFSISRKDLQQDRIDEVIANMLKHKKSLQTICLHHFHDYEIEQFITAMQHCLELEVIDLSENMTEDTQVRLITQLMNDLPRIRKIDLSHSFLSERGIIQLTKTCHSKNIEYDISYNRMSHEKTLLYQKNFSLPKFKLRVEKNLRETFHPLNSQTLVTKIPNHQQDYDYDCGASTMLNIVDYFESMSKNSSKKILKDIVHSIKTCEFSGAEIENMMTWFEEHNFDVAGGFSGSQELLRYYVSLGIPVIVNTNEWGGHYIVVIGFEEFDPVWPEKDKLLCCDPLDYQHGDYLSEQPYAKRNLLQFLDQWRDSKGREGGYIVAFPRELAVIYPHWKFHS